MSLVYEGVKSQSLTVSIISVLVCTPCALIFGQEFQSLYLEIWGEMVNTWKQNLSLVHGICATQKVMVKTTFSVIFCCLVQLLL
jgi:hypothetical protein